MPLPQSSLTVQMVTIPTYGLGDYKPPTMCTPGHGLDITALSLAIVFSFPLGFYLQLAPRSKGAELSLPPLRSAVHKRASLGLLQAWSAFSEMYRQDISASQRNKGEVLKETNTP